MSSTQRVLIVGAGVAGLSSAWWLARQGWSVTVIERSADLRSNGYMLGLSGPGYEALEKMGMLQALAQYDRTFKRNQYLNDRGKPLFSLDFEKVWGRLKRLTLTRTELVAALYQKVQKTDSRILFSVQLQTLLETSQGARATLSNGELLEVDLVIAADGVNSSVRKDLFACEEQCRESLGYAVAAFQFDDQRLANDFESHARPGSVVEFYRLNTQRMASLFVWKERLDDSARSPQEARRKLRQVFSRHSATVRNSLLNLQDEQPLFFDSLTMIDLPRWSKGRVVLLGDAAHCLTLVSGQGAGLAMTSAYILAQELQKHSVAAALLAHEEKLRPAVLRLQQRSRKIAPWFVPSGKLSFWLRNIVIRLLPSRVIGWYFLRAVDSDILAARID